MRASLDLIADTLTAAFLVKLALYPLLAFRGLTLSLKHGNTASSCQAYSTYAALLVIYRDIPSALAFSDLSLALNARFRDITRKGPLLCARGAAVDLWARPLLACKAILEQGVEAALQAGDHPYVLYNAMWAIWFEVESAESIGVGRNNCKKYRALADRLHSDLHSRIFRLYDQFFLCLSGSSIVI